MSKLSPQEVESLSQLRKISGTGGFKFLESTTSHSGLSGYALVVNTDAVFTTFEVNGASALAKSGLSGATIKAGNYLPVGNGEVITAITMSTGDCIIYNL